MFECIVIETNATIYYLEKKNQMSMGFSQMSKMWIVDCCALPMFTQLNILFELQ